MKKAIVYVLLSIGIFACTPLLQATNIDPSNAGRYTISGYIKDASNGESLIGASVYITETKTGTVSNVYGFFSVSLLPGDYELVFSFVGFITQRKKLSLGSNTVMNIELAVENQSIDEVKIIANKPEENIKKTEMSVAKMDMKTIKQIPALMGEVDLIKAIQLLPGVIPAAEGTSAFCVRGGSADQNLILLDECTVYNASHLMGFFSVFNNDAIKDLKLYKGDIPPAYGGRLASLLDVRMKDGNNKRLSGTGGIGLISSRLTLEAPFVKDKGSVIASGRRTYADLFFPLSSDEDLKKSRLYFYDFNLKANYQFNDNNRLYVSGYFGRDAFKIPFASMLFGNNTFSVRWNHLYSQKMFSNLSLVYSKYIYELSMKNGGTDFLWNYDMQDLGAKLDFTWYLTPAFTVKYGLSSVYHKLNPGDFKTTGENNIQMSIPTNNAIESGVYLSFENDITPKLSVKYGARVSLFQNIGKGTIYNFDDNHAVIDSTVYPENKIFNHFTHFEPRLGFKYEIDNLTSIKGSYSRTVQFMQMASTSTAGTPLDIWFMANKNVNPQLSDMGAVGIFRNLLDEKLQTSLEVYYKKMAHIIDFKDHTNTVGNPYLEGDMRFGEGSSYGAEVMVSFPSTKVNGWVSYTYSHTVRTIGGVNNGKEYLAPFDKPHTANVVFNYELHKGVSIGATFVYATGAPATFPIGVGEFGNAKFLIYSKRNTYRIEDYHRLDMSITFRPKIERIKWNWELNLSLYNVYGRKNTWFIRFTPDELDPDKLVAQKFYLFRWVPSLTLNFKF